MNGIAALLGIRPSEQQAVFLMLVQSFFTGICLAYLFSVANAAFLKAFAPSYLPYAYMISGGMGFLMSSAFSRLQQRIPYRILLPGVLIVLALLLAAFTYGLHSTEGNEVVFLIFVLLSPFYSMVALQFWSMAMQLFDLRQGKRLFALLGTGDVLSSFLGFLSVPLILSFFKGEAGEVMLMLLSLGGLLLGLGFQILIFRKFSSQLGEASAQAKATKKRQNNQVGMKAFLKKPYSRTIFAITFCSILGQYFVDFNFMSLARQSFDKSELTAFVGIFFAIIKLIELLSKTFVANRLLKQYGILLGLNLLPALMLVFSLTAILMYSMGVAATTLFVPLAVNKLFDRSLRKAIDDPSLKLLYQPLPTEIRLLLQTKSEGAAKQGGIVVAGLLLLIFSNLPSFSILYTLMSLIAILCGWIFFANKACDNYRKTIRERLFEGQKSPSVYAVSSIEWLKYNLKRDKSASHIATTLRLSELVERGALLEVWPAYLLHRNAEVRRASLNLVKNNFILEALQPIQNIPYQQRYPKEEQKLWEEAKKQLERLKNLDSRLIIPLARSSKNAERLLAAHWLVHHEHAQKKLLLRELLNDRAIEVASTAIRAVNSVDSAELWSMVAEALEKPLLCNVAIPSLAKLGEEVIPLIQLAASRMEKDSDTLMRLMQVAGRIQGQATQEFLEDKLAFPSHKVRIEAIRLLAQQKSRPKKGSQKQLKKILEESCEHIAWVLAAKHDLVPHPVCKKLLPLLEESQQQGETEVFLILSLLYDNDAIRKVQEQISSLSGEYRALALEMLDILLEEDVKPMLAAWIGKDEDEERYEGLRQFFPQPHYEQPEKRLKDILYRDFGRVGRWLRAHALSVLSDLSMESLPQEVEALASHQDFFLKELSLIAIYRADPHRYRQRIQRESQKDQIKYSRVTGDQHGARQIPSNFEEVKLMATHPFFEKLPTEILIKLSEFAEQEYLQPQQSPRSAYRRGNYVHFVIEGSCQLYRHGKLTLMEKGAVLGLLDHIRMEDAQMQVSQETRIFYIDKRAFYALAQLHFPLLAAVYEYLIQQGEPVDESVKQYGLPRWEESIF